MNTPTTDQLTSKPSADAGPNCAPVAGSVRSCPRCTRVLAGGEHAFECRVCGSECCTDCSDTTAKHAVVCDDCLDGGYDDGWTQGRGDSSQNT